MNQAIKLDRISQLLSRFKEQVKILNSNGEFSINIHAENVLISVLNIIYDCDLKNLNYEVGKTYPSIDLRDTQNKIAIQVTSTAKFKKVKDTLELFIKNEFFNEFDKLYIFIITEKQQKYDQQKIDVILNGKFIFKVDDIIDNTDIYKELNSQNNFVKITAIWEILEEQFTDNNTKIESNNSLETIKSQQTTIESLASLLSATEKARVQLSEEIRNEADTSFEKQQDFKRLTTEAEKIRNERQALYRIFPAKYQKELQEEENTKDLEQLSKEADEQQTLRKELEIKENQRNASIKYRLSLNQNALFKYTEALSNINRAIELWPDNFQFQFQLGVLLYELGSFQNAEQILVKMLDTENLNSFEPELQKKAWNTLGMTNLGLRSPRKAIICFEKALDLQSKLHGKMICWGAEELFHNMGIAYLKMDDWNKATYFTSMSLEANKSIYGEVSTPVANSFNSLGELLREQGQHAQAKIQFELALGIFNKLGISVYPGLSILYDNLSHIHFNLSELKDSLKYALLSLSVKTTLYGEKSFYTAKSYLILAQVYKEMKMDAEVLDNYIIAADIYKGEPKEGFNILTLEKKNGLIDAYQGIASHLIDMKAWLNAIPYLEIVRNIYSNDFGKNSIPVAQTLAEIASCQANSQELYIAINLWNQAKTIIELNKGSKEEIDLLICNIANANRILSRKNNETAIH